MIKKSIKNSQVDNFLQPYKTGNHQLDNEINSFLNFFDFSKKSLNFIYSFFKKKSRKHKLSNIINKKNRKYTKIGKLKFNFDLFIFQKSGVFFAKMVLMHLKICFFFYSFILYLGKRGVLIGEGGVIRGNTVDGFVEILHFKNSTFFYFCIIEVKLIPKQQFCLI